MCTYALTERGDKQPTILSYGNTDDFIVWQYGRFHRMALRSVSHILKEIETRQYLLLLFTARTMCVNSLCGKKNSDVLTAADGNKGPTIKFCKPGGYQVPT